MRALPGSSDTLASRGSRHPAADEAPAAQAPLTTCFLTTETQLNTADENSSRRRTMRPLRRRPKSDLELASRYSSVSRHSSSPTSTERSLVSPILDASQIDASNNDHSQPLTPSLSLISVPGSVLSSVSSRRQSLTPSSIDLDPSPAVSTSGGTSNPAPSSLVTGMPVPQLIMPSLTISKRRPFTQLGKSIGKLKLLITGQAGIGKTSLIRSMGRASEDIVYMDPIDNRPAHDFNEIHASTRPCPWWQMQHSPSVTEPQKRWSPGEEEAIDRNICFVDSSSLTEPVTQPARYVESQAAPLLQKNMSDADLHTYLRNGGGSVVDVALYLLPHSGPDPVDIRSIRSLTAITNVIPVLARSEDLDKDSLKACKAKILRDLESERIAFFTFSDAAFWSASCENIYAVSSVTRPDHDTVDASVLMSSEYLPPLVSTDLEKLVGDVLSPEGSAWLRHTAAAKCVDWRRRQTRSDPWLSALCRRDNMPSTLSTVFTVNPFRKQQHWDRVELSNWAEGLRRSLELERLHRLQTQAVDLQLFCSSEIAVSRRSKRAHRTECKLRPGEQSINRDPLGILDMAKGAKCGGQVTLELLSSLGILGYIATTMVRPDLVLRGGLSQWSSWY